MTRPGGLAGGVASPEHQHRMQVDGIKPGQRTALLCYTRTMTPTLLLWLFILNAVQPSGKSSPDTVTSPLYSG